MSEGAAVLDLGAVRIEPLLAVNRPADASTSLRLALIIAFLLHAAVLAAMTVRSAFDASAGAGGYQLEAIGVEIVTAAALMTREPGVEVAAAAAATASERVGSDADASDAPRETRTEPEEQRSEHKHLSVPEPAPAESAEHAPAMPEPPREENLRAEQPVEPRTEGGTVAEGREATHSDVRAVRTAAQAGAVNRFIGDLRIRLARGKPRGLRMTGVATVTFSILPTGELEYARVSSSSGKPALDEAALAAVRRASPYGRPPPWMKQSELVFSIPYHFE